MGPDCSECPLLIKLLSPRHRSRRGKKVPLADRGGFGFLCKPTGESREYESTPKQVHWTVYTCARLIKQDISSRGPRGQSISRVARAFAPHFILYLYAYKVGRWVHRGGCPGKVVCTSRLGDYRKIVTWEGIELCWSLAWRSNGCALVMGIAVVWVIVFYGNLLNYTCYIYLKSQSRNHVH